MRQHLGTGGVRGPQLANGVDVRRVLSAELAQLRLLLLADRSLYDRADQNLLGCGVKPGRRQRADDLTPDACLCVVQSGRRAGRSPARAGGTTADDTADLRPRAIRTLLFAMPLGDVVTLQS